MIKRARPDPRPTSISAAPAARRWLLFIHQLPSQSSNLRVSTWRRLQQIGAIPLKQAVYVLPDTPEAREDFEWLKTEVETAGGDASVVAADHLDTWSDDTLVEDFRRSRQESYEALARDIEHALKRARRTRQRRGTRAPAVGRLTDIFRDRLAAVERIDFFGSAGRDRVLAQLRQLEEHTMIPKRPTAAVTAASPRHPAAFQGRLWMTRPRPGVDRMASAWLVRRFIDPQARFGFAADRQAVPEDAVPYDMFGVELSHHGDGCTFETLCAEFGIDEPAVARIAAIVHDLDLKDGRFGAPECGTVAAMIDGLRLAIADDDALLAQGMTLFDSLYRSFAQAARATGPRPLARPKKKTR
jgi:hypothetical protein